MTEKPHAFNPLEIAVVSTFPPRLCGIATFSRDLCSALTQLGDVSVRVAALDEQRAFRQYPRPVHWQIRENERADYLRVADEINQSSIKVVLIQHEYGLFGAGAGKLILDFLRQVSKPAVTMMHTVLSRPNVAVNRITQKICERSAMVVAPGQISIQMLSDQYRIDNRKLVQIPHGVARLPREQYAQSWSDVRGPTLISFGFLGPNKGLEHVIAALPTILRAQPGLRYKIVGTPHPKEKLRTGNPYRHYLEQLAANLGVADRVQFVDRYVSDAELTGLLADAALCLLPYVDAEQAVSGTLVRAMAAERAIVATYFRHAREVAVREAVHLIPMRDSTSIATAVTTILANSSYRQYLEQRAGAVAAEMAWETVAAQYLGVLRSVAAGVSRQ